MSPSAAYAPAPSLAERWVAPKESPIDRIAAKLRSDGSACFRVFGASMFPWIRTGDLVFVRRLDYEQARRGDVVVFERDARLFVHRVIRVERSGEHVIVTKGDALDRVDAPVTRAEFLGRVIRVHRDERHIDMESLGHLVLGRFLARVSRTSSLFYQPVRALRHLLRG